MSSTPKADLASASCETAVVSARVLRSCRLAEQVDVQPATVRLGLWRVCHGQVSASDPAVLVRRGRPPRVVQARVHLPVAGGRPRMGFGMLSRPAGCGSAAELRPGGRE
jgi:hypothetical protein